MLAIPVLEETLELIGELNGGVRPAVEEGVGTYFIYDGADKTADIISQAEFEKNHEVWSNITIVFGS